MPHLPVYEKKAAFDVDFNTLPGRGKQSVEARIY